MLVNEVNKVLSHKIFLVAFLLIIFLASLVSVQSKTNEKQNFKGISYGVKEGDTFYYQFIDNNSKTEVSLGNPNFIVKNQDNVTIKVVAFNPSNLSTADVEIQINNKSPFAFCLCLPYFMPLNELELIISNGSLLNYGNVSYVDDSSLVLRMINYQDNNVYEESFQRKTGVLNYWLKYHIFDNGSIVFTSMKLSFQETMNYTLLTSLTTETKALQGNSTSNSLSTITTPGFEVFTIPMSILVTCLIYRKKNRLN